MKKSILSTAVLGAMGLSATVGSQIALGAAVTGFTITDVGSNTAGSGAYSSATDGVSGAFAFDSKYLNVKTYPGASFFSGDVGSGTIFSGGANATGSFTTGFIYSTQPFIPYVGSGGLVADVSSGNLTVTTLDFGGQFGGAQDFTLGPDTNFGLEVLWTVARTGPGAGTDFDVAIRWGHDITSTEDPSLMFSAFTAQWVLEGCVTTSVGGKCASQTTVPIPAAAWLFGSGLVGLAGVARRRKTHKA